MNIFILKQIITYIRRNFKVYFCVVIQFTIIIYLLNIFLSAYFNIKEEQDDLEKLGKEQEYMIEASDPSFDIEKFDLMRWDDDELVLNDDIAFPFSEDSIHKIEERYRDYLFNIQVTIELFYLGQYAKEEEDSLKVVYRSDCGTVKMSKETEKILYDVNQETTINSKDFPHSLSEGILATIQGDIYDIEYTEENNHTVIIPFSAYNGLFHKKDMKGIILSIIPVNDKKVTADMLSDIVRLLEEDNDNEYYFNIGNETIDFMLNVHHANNEVRIFAPISGILILLVMIGGIGIFSLVINKRKKEIAICYALGECKSQLCIKSILEISILLVLSYLIGILFSCFCMLRGISVATVEVEPNWKSAVLLLGIALLVIIITVIPVIRLIKKYSPCEILSAL
ncbi:MAG: ABC transporter permease [Lachnospiraceae bacterium]|nr:ABC transporter permease [Lachnospiraceae bacterium]